jgi:hypothetical protein
MGAISNVHEGKYALTSTGFGVAQRQRDRLLCNIVQDFITEAPQFLQAIYRLRVRVPPSKLLPFAFCQSILHRSMAQITRVTDGSSPTVETFVSQFYRVLFYMHKQQ